MQEFKFYVKKITLKFRDKEKFENKNSLVSTSELMFTNAFNEC